MKQLIASFEALRVEEILRMRSGDEALVVVGRKALSIVLVHNASDSGGSGAACEVQMK